MKVPTHQGYHYWVTFIDDFSRFKAVYLLKRKSETFATFKQFKAWAENVTGQKLGCLRDDKGGEYMSREFEAFCIDHGIQRQHSAQNCPQQNGVAERANRTLEEGIRSMLHESGMPPSFLVAVQGAISIGLHLHEPSRANGTLPRWQFDDLSSPIEPMGLHLFLTSFVPQILVRALLGLSVGRWLSSRGRVRLNKIQWIIRVIFFIR